jgi:hypothetical protein
MPWKQGILKQWMTLLCSEQIHYQMSKTIIGGILIWLE